MKQVSYAGREHVVVREGARVAPAPEEVTIAVAYTGICGTDLHIYHGDMDARVPSGRVIGHEMSGRVVDVGSAVDGVHVGDPVTVMPLDWCGRCQACLRGYQHVCQNLVFIGIDAAGSMQEFWNVPARTIVPLPAELPLRAAALVEPTAVAVHDVQRSGAKAGDRVLVVGAGPVGSLIALVAQNVGTEVLVLETNPYRQRLAAAFGLEVVNPLEVDLAARISEWTAGAGVDIAFEVSGAPAGLSSAIDSLAVRGRLCMVAIHTTKPPVDMHRVFWRELTIVGARLYERADFDRAVELVSTGVIPAERFISGVYSFDEAEKAFQTLGAGGDVMKVLVGSGEVIR